MVRMFASVARRENGVEAQSLIHESTYVFIENRWEICVKRLGANVTVTEDSVETSF